MPDCRRKWLNWKKVYFFIYLAFVFQVVAQADPPKQGGSDGGALGDQIDSSKTFEQ